MSDENKAEFWRGVILGMAIGSVLVVVVLIIQKLILFGVIP